MTCNEQDVGSMVKIVVTVRWYVLVREVFDV